MVWEDGRGDPASYPIPPAVPPFCVLPLRARPGFAHPNGLASISESDANDTCLLFATKSPQQYLESCLSEVPVMR